ncbi:uncharacterized protein LOC128956128 [Oppia nitens]|uniref:uncharacterized protein LOC128956128 n=1 Tax=Oppia nitens TaxID=1686743 RepID=UPI0023DB1A65|nr:uncharacterized protein LOC128956128 [Oppia nitens]
MYKIKPEDYNTVSNKRDKFILESLKLITNEKSSYDLIVDLGFGDGRVTRLLSQNVPHKQLVAIDVVPEMLTYALANNTDDPTIEYVLQDMTVSWLELSPRIRQLESKVDLLFTSFMLHYIRDKYRLMAIIGRLLTSGGLFYANTVITKDLNNKKLMNSTVDEQQQQLLCPSIDKQMTVWKQCLVDNGFQIKEFKLITDNIVMNRKEIIDFMPIVVEDYLHDSGGGGGLMASSDHHLLWNIVFDNHFSPLDSESSATAATDESVANPNAWKQFLADNTVSELSFSYHSLQVMAYNKQ